MPTPTPKIPVAPRSKCCGTTAVSRTPNPTTCSSTMNPNIPPSERLSGPVKAPHMRDQRDDAGTVKLVMRPHRGLGVGSTCGRSQTPKCRCCQEFALDEFGIALNQGSGGGDPAQRQAQRTGAEEQRAHVAHQPRPARTVVGQAADRATDAAAGVVGE